MSVYAKLHKFRRIKTGTFSTGNVTSSILPFKSVILSSSPFSLEENNNIIAGSIKTR